MLENRYILIMLKPIYTYAYTAADTRIELYVAALKGDWKAAEKIENDINRVITEKGETTLHIAALARKEQFVRKLVSKLNKEELEKNNKMGNSALCYAAASGNVEIAKLMVKAGNEKLLIPDSGKKHLAMAATIEHGQIVRYVFDKTNNIQYWEEEE
ncbi:hypothetical protein FEM48_Zijuj03G0131100 [Ziziphus jujuba var. spinosa]|uniref:Uncharacterized protein n=1 Tax=Ziziphus jujuba var. spinosa TaxID=714518 RepID=A0A978VQH0_ZIZJJ|nr:hypothetical protein FEM48_Zijuj03G0131100 [Ziziphus jujuba var. spinosa]